jgi:hypothetical protein
MHISLDSALGQQRRLNQVGETISSIAAPTAAYSVRSITGGDPKAVRVRRSSDDGEQDFTVSEINSGALVDYINTSYAKYTSDFSAGDDSWGSFDDVTETGNIDGIGGLDDNLRLAIGSATSQHRAFRSNILPENQKINFSARVFIPSTNSDVDGVRLRDASGTVIIDTTTPTQDQWVTVTASNVTVVNAQLRVDLADGSVTNFAGNGSDVIYLREVTVTQVTSDGFVSKWYDQSGNDNDLSQATASKQPTIVTSGTLNTRNSEPIVQFIQANETHLTGASSILPTGTDIAMTVFHAMHVDASSGNRIGLFGHNGGGNNPANNKYLTGSNTGRKTILKTRDASGTIVTLQSDLVSPNNADAIITYFNSTSDGTATHSVFNLGAQVGSTLTGSNTDQSYESGNTTLLGSRTVTDNFSDSEFFEVIVYASNQLSNRNAIEANLSSKYGIALS